MNVNNTVNNIVADLLGGNAVINCSEETTLNENNVVEGGDDLPENDTPEYDVVLTEDLLDIDYYRTVVIVPDEERITSDIMTMFELSEIIGLRAQQIAMKETVFTNVDNLTNTRDMAIKELIDRKCPLSIVRIVKKGIKQMKEIWACNDMGFPIDLSTMF